MLRKYTGVLGMAAFTVFEEPNMMDFEICRREMEMPMRYTRQMGMVWRFREAMANILSGVRHAYFCCRD